MIVTCMNGLDGLTLKVIGIDLLRGIYNVGMAKTQPQLSMDIITPRKE